MKGAATRLDAWISAGAAFAIALHLLLGSPLPLHAVLLLGAPPLAARIVRRLLDGEFGADLLAVLSLAVSVLMGQYLVGAILVLMLAGGGALESFATRRASAVLEALARRAPRAAHKKLDSGVVDVAAEEVAPGDRLIVYPHEICPVDGVVALGRGRMDESYLTGEPFEIAKTPGSRVLSGAINGEAALTIVAGRAAADSRYASIMRVMEDAERRRPRLRRLGDRLAAWYTPAAVLLAAGAWLASGDPARFLAVLVVATPCPLLIAIPVAVLGAVSLAAGRGIVIRSPAALEEITACRTVILDKTGTLTYGKPSLTEAILSPRFSRDEVLRLAAGLELYSRHPLASAVTTAASQAGIKPARVTQVAEKPGEGLSGTVEDGRRVRITGRRGLDGRCPLPEPAPGLECLVLVDEALAAVLRFHDGPQPESRSFLAHLPDTHQIARILLVSGDREAEVRYLAESVGISEIAAGKSPEEKVAIVAAETKKGKTLFVGDGINDAPALLAATVGVALGQKSDVAAEAAGAVIMMPAIGKLDELLHIGRRMRSVALQSAVGGMGLSVLGMLLAAVGRLTPLQGAVAQEAIDLFAVLNAVRAAFPPRSLTDF